MYGIYEEVLKDYIGASKRWLECIDDNEILKKEQEKISKLEKDGISGYNPYLDEVLHRQADRMTKDFNQTIDNFRQNPEEFAELKTHLRQREKAVKENIFDILER